MLQHLTDPARALSELRRGGHLGITMWGRQVTAAAMTVWDAELERVHAPSAPAFVQQLPPVDSALAIVDVLTGCGFDAIDVRPVAWVDDPDIETFIRRHAALGATGRRMAELAPSTRSAVLDRIRHQLSSAPPQDLRDESEVLAVVAAA